MPEKLFDPAPEVGSGRKPRLEDIRTGKVDFRLAPTPQIHAASKVKNRFAGAVEPHEKAKARFAYYTELSRYSEAVTAEFIRPAEVEYGNWLEKEIRLLDSWCDECPHKMTKARKHRLQEVVITRLEQAIHSGGRSDLAPLLARHRPPPTAQDPADAQKIVELCMDLFGGDLGSNPSDPFDPFAGSARSRDSQNEASPTDDWDAAAQFFQSFSRPKSKREVEKEAQKTNAQALLNCDINRVFKDLVRKLHPDREQDECRRREKEELMKLLTRARDENDYSELLRLHVLVNESEGSTERPLVTESTLKTLTKLLNQKADQLLQDAETLCFMDHLMGGVFEFTDRLVEDRAQIQRAAKAQAAVVRTMSGNLESLLQRITLDSQAFYRYLQRRPKREPKLDDLLDEVFF